MVIDGFMEENGLQATPSPPLPKGKLIRPIQKILKKFEIFPACSYKIKKNSPHKKDLWVGGEYIPWKIRIHIQTTRMLLD